MKKVFISTSSFSTFSPRPLELLKAKGIRFELNNLKRTLTEEEIIRFLKNKDGLIAGTEPLTNRVFNQCKHLTVISRVGAGLNNVDMDCANQRDIKVLNTPDGPTNAVAELTMGLILNLLRHIGNSDRNIRTGTWNKEMGTLLFNKRVGIVGFGRIGRRVAELLRAFNSRVFFYDPFISTIDDQDIGQLDSLDKLLETMDIITLHLPYIKENHHLINKERLELMDSNAFLINAARGGLIDEDALFDLLKNKRIAGAALDTYEEEPYHGKLKELNNVILTSHIGSYARESRILMEIDAVINLLRGFEYAGY